VRRLAPLLLLAVFAASGAAAKGGVEHWQPYSRTAESITGPIALSPTELRMSRARLPLRVAADVPAFKADLGTYPARILAVTRPSNPVLLNGNRLCGGPVRWIVVYRLEHGDLGMAVFSGEAQPKSLDDPGACGTFNYSRQ